MSDQYTHVEIFPASREQLYAFLREPVNLTSWAGPSFSAVWRQEDGWHKAEGPEGEVFLAIEANAQFGVIDFYTGPTRDAMTLWPSRVVPAPNGASAYAFTGFRQPGETPEEFSSIRVNLPAEFDNLRRCVTATAARR